MTKSTWFEAVPHHEWGDDVAVYIWKKNTDGDNRPICEITRSDCGTVEFKNTIQHILAGLNKHGATTEEA